jgi:hypothetical protein
MNYRQMLIETYTEDAIEDCLNAGYSIVNDYVQWKSEREDDQSSTKLMLIDRERGLGGQNYFMKRMFVYYPPQIRFTHGEREVLNCHRVGLNDEEMQSELSITADAVKARWKSVYRRASEVLPNVLPESTSDGRGKEKRTPLMKYLATHPSEFWPYEPSTDCH